MDDRQIRRITAELYRGWLWYDGQPLADYVERVVDRIGEPADRRATIRWAAWLSAAPITGTSEVDLLRRGVPPAVAAIVEVLHAGRWGRLSDYAERDAVRRDAAMIAFAAYTELAFAAPQRFSRVAHARLGRRLGLPVTAPDAPPRGQLYASGVDDAHQHDSPETLLADYTAERRRCCRAAIYQAATAAYPAAWTAELTARWWDSGDRWEAMIATAATRDTERLRLRLNDDRPDVVYAALTALNRVTPGAVEITALGQIVQRPALDWRWCRRSAARRLEAIGGAHAEAALLELCLTVPDPPWRIWPQWLDARGAEHVPHVIAMLDRIEWRYEGPYFLARLGAAEAIPAICTRLPAMPDRIPGIEALGRLSAALAPTDSRWAAVIRALADSAHTAPSFDARDHSLRTLARISPDAAVAAALISVGDVHPVVRDRAARILVRHGKQDAVPALIRLCDTAFATRAAAALGRIGDPRAEPTLWQLFTTGTPKVRAAAGRALTGLPGSIGRLDHLAREADPGLRRAYLRLLSRRPGVLTKQYIDESAHDLDPRVRATTAHAIVTVGDPAHRPVLDLLLADTDPRVRRAATAAVQRLPQPHPS